MNNQSQPGSLDIPSASGVSPSGFSSLDNSFTTDYRTFKGHTEYHLMTTQRKLQELKNSMKLTVDKSEAIAKEVEPIKSTVQRLDSKLKPLMKMVAAQTDKTNNVVKKVEEVSQKAESDSHNFTETVNNVKTEVDSLKQLVNSLQQRVNSNTSSGGSITNEKFTEMFQALERQLGVYDIRIAEMDLRFQVLETTNYNGHLIWRIQDYQRRKDDAKRGRTLSLYSQPFYTSRYGYKMCARIYLNGDGMGKGTHVSIFFVVMKGEYDALVPWPFRQKVTMMCLDQGAERRHLVDTFRPDPNSTSFKRPTSDMNIASGCPLFAAHSVIEGSSYLQDDVLFIRVIVDTGDLEKY